MAEQRVQRRLAAIVAADVVGYSRLMGIDEAGTRVRFNDQLDEIVHPAVAQHRGRFVKTMGDGFLVEFGSVVDSVQCAADIQNGVAARENSAPHDQKMLFRIGVHLGDVIVEGEDIHGDGVNIAARLEGLAEPGGICVSDMVHAGVRNKLALEFTDLGNQLLKNIAEPVQVFSIVFAGADKERNIPDNAMFRRPAVAVLPFENLSGDPEQEFFADGLTEDIITALSLWKSFPVIARNSVFAYKGKSPDIRKVGEELGARYVIEGSVRKSGGRIRVTAQLINSENGHHVWAERYDRELEDIFAVQDEITSTVVGTLEPELARAEFKRVEASPPNSLDAWGLYHRGIAHYGLWNREENLRARKYFEQAIDEDAGFARAYASLSWTYIQAAFLGVSDQDLQMALDSAQRAVALDDKDSFAHLALGRVYHHRKMREEARNELELAISLNPSSAHAHSYIGLVFLYTGHAEQAKHHMELAIRLSPYDPEIGVFLSRLAHVTLQLESYDETIELARKGAQRMDFWPPYAFLTAAYGHLGQTSNAEQARKELERVSPGITIEFVAKHLPADADSLEHLLTGLRVSGLPES